MQRVVRSYTRSPDEKPDSTLPSVEVCERVRVVLDSLPDVYDKVQCLVDESFLPRWIFERNGHYVGLCEDLYVMEMPQARLHYLSHVESEFAKHGEPYLPTEPLPIMTSISRARFYLQLALQAADNSQSNWINSALWDLAMVELP